MIVVWLVVTTTLLVGLLTVGVERAAGDPYEVLDVQLLPSAVSVPERESAVYPSVLYGGLEWALVETRIVPKTDDLFSRPVAVVEVLVRNTTETTPLRVRDSDLALIWQVDQSRHETDRFEGTDNSSRFVVEPGRVVSVTTVFKLSLSDDPEVSQLQLEISEAGRIPARLPLSGIVDESPYPVEASIGTEQAIIADPSAEDRNLIIAPQEARIDINEGPYRAALDEKLTIIEVSVQRTASEGAAFYEESFWELEVGDRRLTPVRVTKSGQPAANEDEVTLLFVITSPTAPAEGVLSGMPEGLVLTVGADASDRYSYQIDLPDTEELVKPDSSDADSSDAPQLIDDIFNG